jgi:CBS domain-containing protein
MDRSIAGFVSAVLVLPGRTSVAEAAARMTEAHVSGAVVAEGDHVVGVVTTNDLREWLLARDPELLAPAARTRWDGPGSLDVVRIADLLTRRPVIARPHWTLEETIEVLEATRLQRLPVVDTARRLIGVVSRDTLLTARETARSGAK